MAKIVGFYDVSKKECNEAWRATNAAFRLSLRGLLDHLHEVTGKNLDELRARYDTKRQASKFRRGKGEVYSHWISKHINSEE